MFRKPIYEEMKKGDKINFLGKEGTLTSTPKYVTTRTSGLFYADVKWDDGTETKDMMICRKGLKWKPVYSITERLPGKKTVLYFMGKTKAEVRRKAKEENPNMIIESVEVKSYGWNENAKEYKVTLRPKRTLKKSYFTSTERLPDRPISARNRRILTILKLEGATSVSELAKRLHLPEKTVEVELKYLQKKGLVRQVGIPKHNGSGKGIRANKGRGGCEKLRKFGKGRKLPEGLMKYI